MDSGRCHDGVVQRSRRPQLCEGERVTEPALYLPDGDGFVGTILTQGTWDPGSQTGAAVLALLGHCLEDVPMLAPMALARLTVDLLRPVPIGPRLTVRTDVLREGKKIQLVQLDLVADDQLLVRASALRLRVEDVADAHRLLPTDVDLADRPQLPPPDQCERIGGSPSSPRFLEGIELRRVPGVGTWIRLAVPVVAGSPIRPTSHLTVGLDFTHLVNADITDALAALTMINPDVTAHVVRMPADGWIGMTGRTSFDPVAGRGVSLASFHDDDGPFAVASTSHLIQRRPTATSGPY